MALGLKRLVFASTALLALTLAARAQTTVAELRGSITDASGATVSAAVVTVQNVETNDVRKGATDT